MADKIDERVGAPELENENPAGQGGTQMSPRNEKPAWAKPEHERPAWAGAVYTTEYTTAATVTVTAVYAKRTGGYIATWRDPAVFEMLADPRHHKAFILLTFIALRARYSKSQSTINGLSTGECLIGDFESCGLTRQEYRTALQKLQMWRFVTIRTTTRGTIAKLLENPIYEYDFRPEQPAIQPANNQRTTK